ncbi:hypothetical protein CVT24_013321 [Panaeolus cyanescens]|uniref:CxC6 like cysteine cluster associated with KDZ domain-containing protein n=1 Tax=Panaeolus cyanescens TaxID=181874 RepID=A0A409YMJ4_9AGAR|nr:hypothetical protein CVT24_013321 [Panaeolus cyanescens]
MSSMKSIQAKKVHACGKCNAALEIKGPAAGGNFPGRFYVHCNACKWHYTFFEDPPGLRVKQPTSATTPMSSSRTSRTLVTGNYCVIQTQRMAELAQREADEQSAREAELERQDDEDFYRQLNELCDFSTLYAESQGSVQPSRVHSFRLVCWTKQDTKPSVSIIDACPTWPLWRFVDCDIAQSLIIGNRIQVYDSSARIWMDCTPQTYHFVTNRGYLLIRYRHLQDEDILELPKFSALARDSEARSDQDVAIKDASISTNSSNPSTPSYAATTSKTLLPPHSTHSSSFYTAKRKYRRSKQVSTTHFDNAADSDSDAVEASSPVPISQASSKRCNTSGQRGASLDNPIDLRTFIQLDRMECTWRELNQVISSHPGLDETLNFEDAMRFIRLAASLKRDIIHAKETRNSTRNSNPILEPPQNLPEAVASFMGDALSLSKDHVKGCWDALKDISWNYSSRDHSDISDAHLFYESGERYGFMLRSLWPPVTFCTNTLCTAGDKTLSYYPGSKRKVVLYTLEDGACATYHSCKTTYHNNYSVKDGIRTYYGGVPDIIEIGKHQFIGKNVANMFMSLMLISWTSATNNAEVYNSTISKPENQPEDWGFTFDLRSEHIWNAIAYLAILEHYENDGRRLEIPHGEEEKDRLSQVICERNRVFDENGQPEWAHYCSKCVRFFNGSDGVPEYYARAIVSDGITIGHPCCNVAHCEVALASKRHRFCPEHMYLDAVCAVEECTNPVVTGTLSCNIPEHVQLFLNYKKRKNANFQRKKTKSKITSTAKPPSDIILTDSGSTCELYDADDVDDPLGDEEEAIETLEALPSSQQVRMNTNLNR